MESACIVLTDIRRRVRFHGVPGAMREVNPGTRAGNRMDNAAHSRSASMPVIRPPLSPDHIDAVAVQERDLNSDDDFGDDGEVVYYHSNTLFSVYALSAGDESVVERYRYDAYGVGVVLDPDWSADADGLSDVSDPYTFTGRRLDRESRLMQYRHRYHVPNLGRFATRDSVEYEDGYNLYCYAGGRSTSATDALGFRSADGGHYVATWQDCQGLSPTQVRTITESVTAACDCMELFINLPASRIPTSWKTAVPCKSLLNDSQSDLRPGVRELVRKAYTKVCPARIECETCCKKGVDAYVYRYGRNIHICMNSYFKASEKHPGESVSTIIHEASHWAGSNHGTGWDSAYTLEDCIYGLCSGRYDPK